MLAVFTTVFDFVLTSTCFDVLRSLPVLVRDRLLPHRGRGVVRLPVVPTQCCTHLTLPQHVQVELLSKDQAAVKLPRPRVVVRSFASVPLQAVSAAVQLKPEKPSLSHLRS